MTNLVFVTQRHLIQRGHGLCSQQFQTVSKITLMLQKKHLAINTVKPKIWRCSKKIPEGHPALLKPCFLTPYVYFISCRPVPVVPPGVGGCLLSFHWRIELSSPSWPWPPSRTASLPSAEFSSSLHARGRGDWPATRGTDWNLLGFYAVQRFIYSFVWPFICSSGHS